MASKARRSDDSAPSAKHQLPGMVPSRRNKQAIAAADKEAIITLLASKRQPKSGGIKAKGSSPRQSKCGLCGKVGHNRRTCTANGG